MPEPDVTPGEVTIDGTVSVNTSPTIAEMKDDLDELHYQASNMGEPWMLDVERHYRWLLGQYLRPTVENDG